MDRIYAVPEIGNIVAPTRTASLSD